MAACGGIFKNGGHIESGDFFTLNFLTPKTLKQYLLNEVHIILCFMPCDCVCPNRIRVQNVAI